MYGSTTYLSDTARDNSGKRMKVKRIHQTQRETTRVNIWKYNVSIKYDSRRRMKVQRIYQTLQETNRHGTPMWFKHVFLLSRTKALGLAEGVERNPSNFGRTMGNRTTKVCLSVCLLSHGAKAQLVYKHALATRILSVILAYSDIYVVVSCVGARARWWRWTGRRAVGRKAGGGGRRRRTIRP
jgi:hypothetical protein